MGILKVPRAKPLLAGRNLLLEHTSHTDIRLYSPIQIHSRWIQKIRGTPMLAIQKKVHAVTPVDNSMNERDTITPTTACAREQVGRITTMPIGWGLVSPVGTSTIPVMNLVPLQSQNPNWGWFQQQWERYTNIMNPFPQDVQAPLDSQLSPTPSLVIPIKQAVAERSKIALIAEKPCN